MLRPPFALLGRTKKYNLKFSGAENVPPYGPFIVVANHQSSVDIVAISLALKPALVRKHMWPWAKAEIGAGREGVLGKLLWKIFGVIPINREAHEIEPAIRLSMEHLRRGEIVCIFPEGTRHKNKELGWFHYGVANLARTVPVPILPVAVYRRDEDGGLQVKVGRPFFMPPKKRRYEALEALEGRVEDRISQRIDSLKQWSADVPRDKKGMRSIANLISMVTDFLARQDISFDKFCRMADREDNEFVRNNVFELLPDGWKKAEPQAPRKRRSEQPTSAPPGKRDNAGENPSR